MAPVAVRNDHAVVLRQPQIQQQLVRHCNHDLPRNSIIPIEAHREVIDRLACGGCGRHRRHHCGSVTYGRSPNVPTLEPVDSPSAQPVVAELQIHGKVREAGGVRLMPDHGSVTALRIRRKASVAPAAASTWPASAARSIACWIGMNASVTTPRRWIGIARLETRRRRPYSAGLGYPCARAISDRCSSSESQHLNRWVRRGRRGGACLRDRAMNGRRVFALGGPCGDCWPPEACARSTRVYGGTPRPAAQPTRGSSRDYAAAVQPVWPDRRVYGCTLSRTTRTETDTSAQNALTDRRAARTSAAG
jgi:hypothetical protein